MVLSSIKLNFNALGYDYQNKNPQQDNPVADLNGVRNYNETKMFHDHDCGLTEVYQLNHLNIPLQCNK